MEYMSDEDFERAKLEEYNHSMEAHKKYTPLILAASTVGTGLAGLVAGHHFFDSPNTLPKYLCFGAGILYGFFGLGMQILDEWETNAECDRDTDQEGTIPAEYTF